MQFGDIVWDMNRYYGLEFRDDPQIEQQIVDLEVYNHDDLSCRNIQKIEQICLKVYNFVLRQMPARLRRLNPPGCIIKFSTQDVSLADIDCWYKFLELKQLLPKVFLSVKPEVWANPTFDTISPLIFSYP